MATLEEQRRFVAEEIARENLALFPNAPKETQDILRTYGQSPISAALLKTSPTIPILPQPTDTTNYNAFIANAQAVIDANTAPKTSDVPSSESTSLETRFNRLMASIGTAPPSHESAFQTAYQTSGVEAAQQEVIRREASVRSAQAKLAGIQAQVQAVINKRDAENLKLEQAASQGQVVGTILNRQQQEVNRQAAIEALPLQALALSAQAEVASLQGESEYAQSTLKMAQDKLNVAFKLKSEDADRQYRYQKDARSAIYDFINDEQKRRMDAKQKESDRDYEREKDNLNNAQSIANSLMGSGQGELAAKITSLDPKDPKFSEKLAELQKQAQPIKQLSDFEQAFLRDKGRLPTVQELLDFKAREAAAGRKPGEGDISEDVIDTWARRINSGTDKISSVPDNIRNKVIARTKDFAEEDLSEDITAGLAKGIKPEQLVSQLQNAYPEFSKAEVEKKVKGTSVPEQPKKGGLLGKIGSFFGSLFR